MLRGALFALFRKIFNPLYGTSAARLIWRLPGSRQLYSLTMRTLKPSSVTVRGHVLVLDPEDSLLLSVRGAYEDFEISLFEGCVRPGDVVVDVGAHIGLYSLAAARAVGPTGSVYAFEPLESNRHLLLQNLAANGYTTVRVSSAAISGKAGTATLSVSVTNSGDNYLVTGPEGQAAVTVATTTLTEFLDDEQQGVDVLKLDIQGGEPAALQGARSALDRQTDVVLFTEVSPVHLGGGDGVRALGEELVDQGFELFVIDEAARSLSLVSPDDLASRTAEHHLQQWNLVCTKGPLAAGRVADAVVSLTENLGTRPQSS